MKRLRTHLFAGLSAAQGRFRRARPGSVLIMVVSLLVLLALIGTAAMSTSRLDRVSSLQGVRTTQLDTMAEGVKQMVTGSLAEDRLGNPSKRWDASTVDGAQQGDPLVIAQGATPQEAADTLSAVTRSPKIRDAILASRVPERLMRVPTPYPSATDPMTGWNADNTHYPPVDATHDYYAWPSVSYPPVPNNLQAFVANNSANTFSPFRLDVPNEASDDPAAIEFYQLPLPKPRFNPTVIPLPDGKTYPALQAADSYGNPMTQMDVLDTSSMTLKKVPLRIGTPFLAGDADGDGVADSLLFKLPKAAAAGSDLTYYGAVRVVDNSAQINVNTAWSPEVEAGFVRVKDQANPQTWTNQPITGGGDQPISLAGVWPASVDLRGLLPPDQTVEMQPLNSWRFFHNRTAGGAIGDNPNQAGKLITPTTGGSFMTPYNEGYDAYDNFAGATRRDDYRFLTAGDALHNQLGRRLENPAFFNPNNRYSLGGRPFGLPDAMALAYRFTLVNPDTHDSAVEQTLPFSLYQANPRTSRYELTVQDVRKWFIDNFDYPWLRPDGSSLPGQRAPYNPGSNSFPSNMPLRALLTSFNPVGNYTNIKEPVSRTYAPPTSTAVNLDGEIDAPFLYPYGNPLFPLRSKLTKTNINTATFADLWTSFLAVMRNLEVNPVNSNLSTFRSPFDAGALDPIYQGNRFLQATPYSSNTTEQHRARMFRSPLRPVGTDSLPNGVLRMHPYQVMNLRAAIAAVNAQALRSDIDVRDDQNPGQYIIRDTLIPFADVLLPPGTNTATFHFGKYLGATVYGVKRQPFITEVLMSNNVLPLVVDTTRQNQSGFVAIEIHNPYDRPMDISGWKLSVIDRRHLATGAAAPGNPNDVPPNPNYNTKPVSPAPDAFISASYRPDWLDPNNAPTLTMVDLPSNASPLTPQWDPTMGSPSGDGTGPDGDPDGSGSGRFRFDPDTFIPPHGFLIVSNFSGGPANAADTDTAQYVPGRGTGFVDQLVDPTAASRVVTARGQIYTDQGVRTVYLRHLHHAIGREVVLSRPVVVRQATSPTTEVKHKLRWAPVDSFDSTGLNHQVFSAGTSTAALLQPTTREWHYVRSNDPTAGRAWHFVYPGRYDASPAYAENADRMHHQGIESTAGQWTDLTQASPWTLTPPASIRLGLPDQFNSRDNSVANPTLVSTFPIQIANTDFSSHFNDYRMGYSNSPIGGYPTDPMHGFLRVGDILHVTYIGSYTLWRAPTPSSPASPVLGPPQAYDAYDPGVVWSPTAKTHALNPEFIEVNALPMDAAMAEDTDPADDRNPRDAAGSMRPLEDVGRFAPLNVAPGWAAGAPAYTWDVQSFKEAGRALGTGAAELHEVTLSDNLPNLRLRYPDNFWNGYECVIYNDQRDPTANEWQVQVGVVQNFTKNDSGQARLALTPLAFPLVNGRTYSFRLQLTRYGWADKLYDYFTTINAPADDYSVNVDPDAVTRSYWGNELANAQAAGRPYIPDPIPNAFPVKNTKPDGTHLINRGVVGGPVKMTEDDVPSEGLININTANWRVLAQLPLVMQRGNPTLVDRAATEYLARQIVYYRDVDDGRGFDPVSGALVPHPHGPFKSAYELLMIPEFEACINPADGSVRMPTQNPLRNGNVGQLAYDPNVVDGDFSPLRAVAALEPARIGDGVRWDWKEKYLMVNRISNLITLRSDCFTVYVQVQAWRDAGTPQATMVGQRRIAFIVDRSRVVENRRTPTVYNVPVAD